MAPPIKLDERCLSASHMGLTRLTTGLPNNRFERDAANIAAPLKRNIATRREPIAVCLLRVCAVVRRRFSSGCKPHPAIAPAGSNRSSHGGDEMAEAFG